jgi:hypothetical protein
MTNQKTSSRYVPVIILAGLFLLGMAGCVLLELAIQQDTPESEDTEATDAPETADISSVQLSSDFSEMVSRVQRMRRSRIANQSDQEILSLGRPIRQAVSRSVAIPDSTLRTLEEPVRTLTQSHSTLSRNEHNRLSSRIKDALAPSGEESLPSKRLSTEQIRQILLNINDRSMSDSCGELFNVQDDIVLLTPGDPFDIANKVCPAGSIFVVLPGSHEGQAVESSKNGNQWIGVGAAIMDGVLERSRAFNEGLNGNTISHLDIRNYTDHGVYGTGSRNVRIINTRFQNIAPEKHGQEHGAVMFQYAENLEINGSHFEEVASSVRFRNSKGPLKVTGNKALNSGRNFFQCDKCNGKEIRINRNSMEQTSQFGDVPLEDWINLFESSGEPDDWIQVNNNRAKGYGESDSGSFIMLADAGGTYQEAVGNIGVSPGQVGIGIAGGEHIRVERNKMYSEGWESSNVAFYSAEYSRPCGYHQFPESTNVANWRRSGGQLNRSWSDGRCGITNAQIRQHVVEDTSMGPEIWDEWQD